MIGCLTALSLLKKKFKVLVIEKSDLLGDDSRTLAVNARSRDFLKNLNLWKNLKKTQSIKNIYIKDFINSQQLVFENHEEDMGTVIYNKDLLSKTRKILLDRKLLYKNIDISIVDLLEYKKLGILDKSIEFKKIILTTGKQFNDNLISRNNLLLKVIRLLLGFLITPKIIKIMLTKFLHPKALWQFYQHLTRLKNFQHLFTQQKFLKI